MLCFQLPSAHEIPVGLPGVVAGLALLLRDDRLSLTCGLQRCIEVDPNVLSLRAPSTGAPGPGRYLITRMQRWQLDLRVAAAQLGVGVKRLLPDQPSTVKPPSPRVGHLREPLTVGSDIFSQRPVLLSLLPGVRTLSLVLGGIGPIPRQHRLGPVLSSARCASRSSPATYGGAHAVSRS